MQSYCREHGNFKGVRRERAFSKAVLGREETYLPIDCVA